MPCMVVPVVVTKVTTMAEAVVNMAATVDIARVGAEVGDMGAEAAEDMVGVVVVGVAEEDMVGVVEDVMGEYYYITCICTT